MIGIQMAPGETAEDYAMVHVHSVPKDRLPPHCVGDFHMHEHPFEAGHPNEPPHPLPGFEEPDE